MRLYVVCHSHPDEKIYLRLEGKIPEVRSDIPFGSFIVECPTSGKRASYLVSDVMAEEGATLPLVGSAVGALLFLFAPLAGLVGAVAGLLGGAKKEAELVKRFNGSEAP